MAGLRPGFGLGGTTHSLLVSDAGVPPGGWACENPPGAIAGLMASWVCGALLVDGGEEASEAGVVAELGMNVDVGEPAWLFRDGENGPEVPGRAEK